MSPSEARALLRALNDGKPPPPALMKLLTVGRDELWSWFEAELENIASGDYVACTMLGDMGSGKSHALSLMRDMALHSGHAVSLFAQDMTTHGTLNRPDRIYAAILENLSLPEPLCNAVDPVREVLKIWATNVARTIDTPITGARYIGLACEAGLIGLSFEEIPPRTRMCLLGAVLAVRLQDDQLLAVCASAISKTSVENRMVLAEIKAREERFNVWPGYTPSKYDMRFHLQQLRVIIHLMLKSGARGLVVLSDEATGIADLRVNSRQKAYDVVETILANDNGLDYCAVFLAFMPAFLATFNDDMRRRVVNVNPRWRELWRDAVIELEPLDPEQKCELAVRILEVRRNAGLDGVVPRDQIMRLAQSDKGSIRDWVRYWVSHTN